MKVDLARSAKRDIAALPVAILLRVRAIIIRLEGWPDVSGAKPMRGPLKGHYRIRTGDWRVLFKVSENVIVVRVAHRSTIYEE